MFCRLLVVRVCRLVLCPRAQRLSRSVNTPRCLPSPVSMRIASVPSDMVVRSGKSCAHARRLPENPECGGIAACVVMRAASVLRAGNVSRLLPSHACDVCRKSGSHGFVSCPTVMRLPSVHSRGWLHSGRPCRHVQRLPMAMRAAIPAFLNRHGLPSGLRVSPKKRVQERRARKEGLPPGSKYGIPFSGDAPKRKNGFARGRCFRNGKADFLSAGPRFLTLNRPA